MNTDHDTTMDEAGDHPSAGEMAAYVDGVDTADERRSLEAHLGRCGRCREELVAVRDATRSRPSRRRWVAGAVATAAAITLLVLTPTLLDDGSEPLLRGTDAADPAATPGTIEVVAPGDTFAASLDDLRFTWRSAGPDAQYRLTITTAAGDPVTSVTTADTMIASLGDAGLLPDTEYYWWVEALRADRTTAESGLQSFVWIEP